MLGPDGRRAGHGLQGPRGVRPVPCHAVGDDIEFYADEPRSQVLMTWHGLRQQHERPAGKPNYCLAGFRGACGSGVADYGRSAVTAGLGIDGGAWPPTSAHDDYHAIMLKRPG